MVSGDYKRLLILEKCGTLDFFLIPFVVVYICVHAVVFVVATIIISLLLQDSGDFQYICIIFFSFFSVEIFHAGGRLCYANGLCVTP